VGDLRVGVIGLGLRGGLGASLGSKVVAICDTDPGALDRAHTWYGNRVARFTHYLDLLSADVDAVLICTPDHTHEELACAALEAGKATYVEKPLAITVDGCDHILTTARRTGSRLYVGHNMRHMGFVQLMSSLIAAGAIGEVQTIWCRHFVGHGGDFYYKDWHAERANTTGLLVHKGAHDIDIIHWLAGAPSRRVTAFGKLAVYRRVPDRTGGTWYDPHNWPPLAQTGLNRHMDVEDLSLALFELSNGVLASYQQCHFAPDYWRNYTVIGTEGRLENFGDTEPGSVIKLWNRRSGWRGDGDRQWKVPLGTGGHGGADASIVDEFARFARVGGPTLTSPVAARDSVAAGVMATMSLRSGGQPQDVPAVDAELAAYFDAGQPP
jgi:predicted dehydrogenase